MIQLKSNSIVYNTDDIYEMVKDDMLVELKANGYRSVRLRQFRHIVYHYWKVVYNLVIYKYETVELGNYLGWLTGKKILCTKFNPINLDINATDGFYYFIFWDRPKKLTHVKMKVPSTWKKKLFNNVRYNGADYPEIIEGEYGK